MLSYSPFFAASKFQFYISTIIPHQTSHRELTWKSFNSILVRLYRVFLAHLVQLLVSFNSILVRLYHTIGLCIRKIGKFQFYISTIIPWESSRTAVCFARFQFYISTIIPICSFFIKWNILSFQFYISTIIPTHRQAAYDVVQAVSILY